MSDQIDLNHLADLLGRAAHTVRQWVKDAEKLKDLTGSVPEGHLSEELWPKREGGRNKMFWTADQIAGLEAFAQEREDRRGWPKPA